MRYLYSICNQNTGDICYSCCKNISKTYQKKQTTHLSYVRPTSRRQLIKFRNLFSLFPCRAATVRGGRGHESGTLLSIPLCFSQRLPVQNWLHDSGCHRAQGQRRQLKHTNKERHTASTYILLYCKLLWLFFFFSLHVEFSRRWCTLNDAIFSYYESDKNSNPNGALKSSEIVCLAVDMPKKHGYAHKQTQDNYFFFLYFLFFHISFYFLLTPQV